LKEFSFDKKTKMLLLFLATLNIILIISKNILDTEIKCSSCHMIPYLGIGESTLEIMGIGANLILSVMIFFYNRNSIKYFMLLISFVFSVFSIFMQISRYFTIAYQRYCLYCLATTTIFILIFILLLNSSKLTHKNYSAM